MGSAKAANGKATTGPVEKPSSNQLAHQYGGNSISGWVGYLPKSWVPYVQLARLSPPAGIVLIYFPHLFGILLAASINGDPPSHLVKTLALMLGGSVFLSNALHIWDDLVDAPLDALVERTRNRPIPRGAVSPFAAFVYTLTQTICAALFLPYVPSSPSQIALYAIPSIIGWAYYPMAKRHTHNPQLVLGFCIAWGLTMGWLATTGTGLLASVILGDAKSSSEPIPSISAAERSAVCLFLAVVLWVITYDTIYAHQDIDDDIRAGIYSLAVQWRDRTKELLWWLLTGMVGLLIACGWFADMGAGYYAICVGGSATSLGLMIARVDLKDKASCWWWFGNGFWFAGGSITGGLLAEYVARTI